MPGQVNFLESRRKLLQCGGLATLGLSLPDLLRADDRFRVEERNGRLVVKRVR